MDDKKMNLKEKLKEGVSVQELENLARKYTVEVFFIFSIFIATISSIWGFFIGYTWSLLFFGIGSILSVAFPEPTLKFSKKLYKLFGRQDKPSQVAVGIVRIVLAIFLPLIIFAELGMLTGVAFHHLIKAEKSE
jgi:hypothetical protein